MYEVEWRSSYSRGSNFKKLRLLGVWGARLQKWCQDKRGAAIFSISLDDASFVGGCRYTYMHLQFKLEASVGEHRGVKLKTRADERTTLGTYFCRYELFDMGTSLEEPEGIWLKTTFKIGKSIHSGYLPERRFILVNSICIVECPKNGIACTRYA